MRKRSMGSAGVSVRRGMNMLWFLGVLFAISCNGVRAQSAEAAGSDLRFVGIVTSITASPVTGSNRNWLISTGVEKIESGKFVGKTFSFRIHSPTRSGVAVGKRYHFHALKTNEGYAVNELEITPQE